MNLAVAVHLLDDGTEHFGTELVFFHLAEFQLEAEQVGAGLEHADGLREQALVHKAYIGVGFHLVAAAAVVEHDHGFGSGRAFVQKGGVGQGQPGHVGHHGLVVQQGFQTALGNLGLVRGVRGVPSRVFKDVAGNHGRGDAVVVAHPDIGTENLVLGSQFVKMVQVLVFVHRFGQVHRLGKADGCRDGLFDQFVHAFDPDGFEHLLRLLGVRPVVTTGEVVCYHIVFCLISCFIYRATRYREAAANLVNFLV